MLLLYNKEGEMNMYVFIFTKRNIGKINLKLINGIETFRFLYNFDFGHIDILHIENIKLNQNSWKIKS